LLLGYPQWVLFFDADNFVPSALLEYTFALGRLFLSAPMTAHIYPGGTLAVDGAAPGESDQPLHHARICWASKPSLHESTWPEKVLGRCSSVVSPVVNTLVEDHFGLSNASIAVSNAGEQGRRVRGGEAVGALAGDRGANDDGGPALVRGRVDRRRVRHGRRGGRT
jgi:hypothetical protein